VDWSATDKRKDFHILRASLSLHGRSEVIYEEVHEESDLNNRKVHNRFLHKLKKILPLHLKVILLTDAGFCNPWFKEAKRLGFDFIGRTKSETQFSEHDGKHWEKCSTLYDKATNQAKLLQNCLLAKTNKMACHIVLYKETIKGRVRKTRGGKKCQSSHSKRIAKRQKTPWVLVTSIDADSLDAKRIVRLYKKRMQIEEGFRDTKSNKYGFSLRDSLSKNTKRFEILLLLASLATLLCWLVSLVAKAKNQHLDFQANTIKKRTVLSAIYLGCQLIRKRFDCTMGELKQAWHDLQYMVREAAQ